MNVGASLARGDALLFLHADCRLPAGADRLVAQALDAGRAWGRFDVELEPSSALLRCVAALMNARSAATGICTGDQALFAGRAAFEAIGGYPAVPLMEDIALSHRLRSEAGAPARIRERVIVSSRRWKRHGTLRTIALMWTLRYRYWRGDDPHELARRYERRAPALPPLLLVFAKVPVPGQVKTRLAASIGNEHALSTYRSLALQTLATAAAARRAGAIGEIELWATPEHAPGELADWCERFGCTLRAQHGADLGARMQGALSDVLRRGRKALLIGTDVPGYDVAYLAEAASMLDRLDAVFGPAEDGGYVLAGLARELPVFDDIPWSTARVMASTRERLRTAGATWHELPMLWDVDTQVDLERWKALQRERGSECAEATGGVTARSASAAASLHR